MRMKWIAATAVAVTALSGGEPAAALQVDDVAVVMPASPRPADPYKAARLKNEAVSLFDQPSEWKRAARLLERSAKLWADTDEEGYECLMYAGRVWSAVGDMRSARVNFEKAAAQALARGAVIEAAHAYIDAAHVAVALKDAPGAQALMDSASLLAHSPLISSADRNQLMARLNA